MIAIQSFLTALSVEYKVAMANTSIVLSNERVFYVLEQTSPQQFPRNAQTWWDWWKSYNEQRTWTPTVYLYQPMCTSYQQYSPIRLRTVTNSESWVSCFLAGTKVMTETGQQAMTYARTGAPGAKGKHPAKEPTEQPADGDED